MRKVKKAKSRKPCEWATLIALIDVYAEALIADSWKGGGDPEAVPLIETELRLAKLKLDLHISTMRRLRGEES